MISARYWMWVAGSFQPVLANEFGEALDDLHCAFNVWP